MGIILLALVSVFATIAVIHRGVLGKLQAGTALLAFMSLIVLYFNMDTLGAIALGIVASVCIVMVGLIQFKKVDLRMAEKDQELFELKEQLKTSQKRREEPKANE